MKYLRSRIEKVVNADIMGEWKNKKTFLQRVKRAWWILLSWFGVKPPMDKLEEIYRLGFEGRDEEAIQLFHEIGGTVERAGEPPPLWSELGDTWNEEDGEIWNVEPCYHGGRMVYVGNIFKDPVIRGKENPYFGKC